VVGGVYPDELFGAPEAVVKGLELGAGAVLVAGAVDEDARAAKADGVGELGGVEGGETGGDDAAGAVLAERRGEGDNGAGTEAEAGEGIGEAGVAAQELGDRSAGILDLAGTTVVTAMAEIDAAEVEAQHDAARAAQAAGQAINHFVVQGAAVDGMGMADESGLDGRGCSRYVGVGLFEQRFEATGGAGNEERLDAARHGQRGQFVR